jgi:hypothetical protein
MTPEEARNERRRQNQTYVVSMGCRDQSIDEMRRGLRLAEQNDPDTFSRRLSQAVSSSMRNQAVDLALYLINEENAHMREFRPDMLAWFQSLPVWSALVARGWDINARSSGASRHPAQKRTLLEMVCSDEDLVRWCLDHGATVDDPDVHVDEHNPDTADPAIFDVVYPPVLESVALSGSISTFRLLRAQHGARIGRRTLHMAAQRVAAGRGAGSMDMLRYLVDEVGLDVNQMDSDKTIPLLYGPPINYAIHTAAPCSLTVRFLLERGADPYVKAVTADGRDAFEAAEYHRQLDVLGVLQEWRDGKIQIQRKN